MGVFFLSGITYRTGFEQVVENIGIITKIIFI